MRILSGLLMIAMLLMAACGGGDDATPTPASTPEVTPTPAVVQEATPDTATAESTTAETGVVTETTGMTDSMGMTETTTLTGTEGMTDTGGMTETCGMTETSGLTETGTTTATGAAAGGTTATATLQDAAGAAVGEATLTEVDGGVVIEVTLEGLTVEAAGEHGIHLHTTGACTPDFQAAGGHFNPTNAQHGMENPNGPHAGDLPNIEIDADGNATYEATAALVTLGEGENSLLDADGSALVVHAGPDDMKTDPSGDSGDRIACGVIEQQ